ncbi:NADH-quinone oxidoreductase subunit J family protein [Candidatus Nitrospira salsa]|nr:MAG: NADH dehydrogenase subunit J [Nitrospirales bacterium]
MMWLLFAYFSTVSIVAGVMTVAFRNPVHCGLALLTLLLHVAGLFVLLNAEFLFAVQIIVYAGAILVLYLFVLMLLNLKTEEQHLHRKYALVLFASVGIFCELLFLLLQSPYGGVKGTASPEVLLATGPSQAIGITMFSDYLLLFEIVGVFLLGAIIGAIVLAKTPSTIEPKPE